MKIEVHRADPADAVATHGDSRVSIELDDVRQVHVGHGGVTVITTPFGRIAVREGYDEVLRLTGGSRREAGR